MPLYGTETLNYLALDKWHLTDAGAEKTHPVPFFPLCSSSLA